LEEINCFILINFVRVFVNQINCVGVSDLKRKTVKGFFWSSLESLFSQGLGIIFGIFLARMLSPNEFGLLGMITIFISVAQVFVDSGLSQSLIRKQNCVSDDYSTIFWVNQIIGLLSYIIIWICAPVIANFYGKPELVNLTRVSSLAILIGSFTLIQQTILIKEIDFKTLTKSSTLGTLFSGIASLLFAYWGYGVWSLVWRTIINQFIRSAVIWNHNKWRPKLFFNKQILKEHFGFSSNILLISIIAALYKNLYNLIIGKNYSEKILGYYTNADQYSSMASNTISAITNKVSYPALSEMQNDEQRLKASIKTLVVSVMYISFIVMFGLAAIARPLFVIVLGEKWLPSVLIFQALCIAYSISPMHIINQNIMKIKGRSDLFLKTEILKYVIFTPILILGAIYGIRILIAGIVLFYWIGYAINAMYSNRLAGYSTIAQCLDFLPVLGIAIVPAILSLSLGIFFPLSNILLLGIQVVLYPALVVILSVLFKIPSFFIIKQILKEKLTVSNIVTAISRKY
jgi:teichuronic acid exporter